MSACPPVALIMCARDDQTRPVNQSRVDGISQVDRRPFGIESPHVAESGKSVAHVLLREMQTSQSLGWRALQCLLPQRKTIDAEMHMGIDEPRRHSPVTEVDNLRILGSPNRAGNLDDGVTFDQDLSVFTQRLAKSVEQLAADQHDLGHRSVLPSELSLQRASGARHPKNIAIMRRRKQVAVPNSIGPSGGSPRTCPTETIAAAPSAAKA